MNWNAIKYIFQIPLSWFRDIDRRANIIGDGQIVRVDKHNPDGTHITIDRDGLDIPDPEDFDIPSTDTGTPTDATDYPTVFDTGGTSITWQSGGANGLAIDCYCKLGPQSSGANYSVFQRATFVFSKDGLLVSANLSPDRIRIQAKNA